MKRNKHQATKTDGSIVTAIVIGVLIALVLSTAFIALISSLIQWGNLEENHTSPIVFLCRAVSLLIGSLIGSLISKEKHLMRVGATALGYLLILFAIGIVFFDGSFRSCLSGVASIVFAGVIAIVLLQRGKGSKRIARKYSI